MRLRLVRRLKGLQVHYADHQSCFGSRSLQVLMSKDQGVRWQPVLHLPISAWYSLLTRVELAARLTRGGVHAILPIDSPEGRHLVIVAAGGLYTARPDGSDAVLIHSLEHGHRPLRRGIVTWKTHIVFGEYWNNPNRAAVAIHALPRLSAQIAQILYQFPAGKVRHIHAVEYDPYTSLLWIATGDVDHECMIATLNPDSGQIAQIIGQGSQQWRAVSFAFRPDRVYWGTDAPHDANQLWAYDRSSQIIYPVSAVIGPVYYNICLDDYIVFGTSMEKGEGQQDGFGRCYVVDHNENVHEVWKQKKDWWDARFFGYGVFEFAEGHLLGNQFWVTARGFKGGVCSYLYEIEND